MSKTSPFAGLMAGFRGVRAEDEKPTDDQAARDALRAEEDEKREEEDARRAEEDERRTNEDARRAEEDGAGPDDKKGAKRADEKEQDPEADADDDDTDAEEGMDEKDAKAFRRGLAVGRTRENARGTRIFLAAAQAGRPDLGATLAFTTRNTSGEATRVMQAAVAGTPAPSRPRTLDNRMGSRTEPRPGGSAPGGGMPSFGERVKHAVAKVRKD